MDEVLLIFGMFLVTFSVRYVLFAAAGKVHFPGWLNIGLGFVPPAVLTAIAVPAVLMPRGELWLQPDNPWLVAGLFAAIISVWRRDLLTTIVSGMAFFMLLRFGLGF
ncbi:AzlD domain-containing protein [Amphritea balenae]|uniref:AzlD domain-containing protein n=1 Tax=Amphritea balenae TaxID=452629 RepID=A0A3P1SZ27_9GAMM|nr:AzlD domain-containing protein [Amphritea balenae]RRD01373.1 AzlD domain-containing protein [Amphritea balenae]GGK57637.1 branched-chain amino acid ABC transporter [Amphritea balenae]